MNFKTFKQAVQKQFAAMSKGTLFRTEITGDKMWETYLASFPIGTNPTYRERTEHDCSCCRQFVKNIGGVVAFGKNNEVMTIWDIDITGVDDGYKTVAKAMADLIREAKIDNIYLHNEKTIGTDKNFEDTVNGVQTWEHFHVTLPTTAVSRNIGPTLGEARATHDVLLRSITEITPDAVSTVLELIAQNSLYRGAEHKNTLEKFQTLLTKSRERPTKVDLDDFSWIHSQTNPAPVTRIRNTSIGTLLVDISDGLELEDAVKKFEAMVAPANYKRPTALVTKKQIEQAKAKIEELGLTPALERRYARIDDITVNNVLFADRDARKAMGADVFGDLADNVKTNTKKLDKIEEVPIDKFLTDILPQATSVEVLVENRHNGNFMSLIAPADPSAPNMFKWDNGFSWSYNGDVADSMKERVKAAGGNVTGELCCRLAWEYADDLDFHMHEQGNGHRINFSNRRQRSPNGGMLDVDANGIDGPRPHPCENIFYEKIKTMRDGAYRLVVNNYNRRSDGVGFEVEIDLMGVVTHLAYEKAMRSGENVEVAVIHVKAGVVTVEPLLASTTSSKDMWGVSTQTFRRVTSILPSPNHWDGHGVGNKHYFFMIDGCKNEGKARGFYNEFLKSELDPHRKVLEMVGTKMKTDESDDQLSGLGFSTTQRNDLTLRVKGKFTRAVKVLF